MNEIKELRLRTGMTAKKFAETFAIPRGTLSCWEASPESARYSRTPQYVLYMLKLIICSGIDLNNLVLGEPKKLSEYRKILNFSQIVFAERFFIPRRTLESWECPDTSKNHRRVPPYLIRFLQIADENGLLDNKA